MPLRSLLLSIFLALCGVLPLSAAEGVIDEGRYASPSEAAKNWLAREGTLPATLGEVEDGKFLLLSCQFVGTKANRAVWDRATTLDLSQAEGIEFELRCDDPAAVSSFSFYFQSGDGWYSIAFTPPNPRDWTTITLRKDGARVEGKPLGWNQVTGLRLAAWRGDDLNTNLYIRNVRLTGVLGVDTHILVARPDSQDKGDLAFLETVSTFLGNLGLRHATLPEADLTPDKLNKTDLVVLPHNPRLPDHATTALASYLQSGGHLLAFYTFPSALEQVIGISRGKHLKPATEGQFSSIRPVAGAFEGAPAVARQASWNIVATQAVEGKSQVLAEWFDAQGQSTGYPAVVASSNAVFLTHVLLPDDAANKERLLLAMAGRAQPRFWESLLDLRKAALNRIGRYHSFDTMAAATPGMQAAVASLATAQTERQAGHFGRALDLTEQAIAQSRQAYCLAQTSQADEFRAFWCHSAFGVKGMTWDDAIAKLKANGFTAVMPNMLWGGIAYYPSKVLPVSPEVATRGDQIAECLAACRRHGIQMHVWKVNWNLGDAVPPEFLARLRREGRLQQSNTGEELAWLCPSHPENLKLEREALLEVARNYAIDGIHFDYIRYPGSDHCFCPRCRERFETATAKPVAKWPADVLAKGARREEWIKWCQDNITALVKSTSAEVRKLRPGIQISAAVFRNWTVDSIVVMQDWKQWCEKGYLDFVCPMDYTASLSTYDTWVRKQKEWAGPARLVPGIGASSSRTLLPVDQVIEQIQITRQHRAGGFIIFNLGPTEISDLLPSLSLGITKP